MALLPVPGNACAIRLAAAVVLASCGSNCEPASRAFGAARANTTFAIRATAIQAATITRLRSRDGLWLSSADTLAIVLTGPPSEDIFKRMYQFCYDGQRRL